MKLLSYQDLREVKGIKRTKQAINRQIRNRAFPKPIKIGGATSPNSWIESEIDAWLEQKMLERA